MGKILLNPADCCRRIMYIKNLKMLNSFILTLFLSATSFISFAQNVEKTAASAVKPLEIYSRVQVAANDLQRAKMYEAIGFDHLLIQPDGSFIGEFSQSEISKMTELGAKVKVLIPDVVKDFITKNNKKRISNINSDLTLPNGFTYGSMGGYLTFDEVVAKLDQLRTMYPNLITIKQSIGKSTENRDLWVVKISDNPDIDENEPKVFFNALTHAREPAGMMQMIYYMCYILQNYNADPEIKHLIDNRELYFEPVVNPDGYEYNRSLNASGGGMWRKNRYKVTNTTTTVSNCKTVITGTLCDTTWKTTTPYTTSNCRNITTTKCDTSWNKSHTTYTLKNCRSTTVKVCDTTWGASVNTYTTSNCRNTTKTTCDTTRTSSSTVYGVDLNRNYGYKWGFDNTGSSATNTSDTYRGPYAFSEPELIAVRDFSILKQFKEVSNQHTPGNDLTYPFSYNNSVVNPEQAFYNLKNSLATEDNHFTIGHMLQTQGYLANGEASDWQFGDQITKPKAYSWTPELGTTFWPTQAEIEPLCLTNIRMNDNIAWMAAEYFRYSANAGLNTTSATFTVPVTIINYGDNSGSVETIKFIPLSVSTSTSTGNDSISLNGITPGMTTTKNLTLSLSGYSGTGTISGVLRISYSDGYTQDKPFSFTYALPLGLRKQATTTDAKKVNDIYSLYPNPTGSLFHINSTNNEVPVSVSVYDMNGSIMKTIQNTNDVDLSGLANGIYTIRIETTSGIIDKKITKQ